MNLTLKIGLILFCFNLSIAQEICHVRYNSLKGPHSFFLKTPSFWHEMEDVELICNDCGQYNSIHSKGINLNQSRLITTMSFNSGKGIAYFLFPQPGDSITLVERKDGTYHFDGSFPEELNFFQHLEENNLGIFLNTPLDENGGDLNICQEKYQLRLNFLNSKNLRPVFKQVAEYYISRLYLYWLLSAQKNFMSKNETFPHLFQKDLEKIWGQFFNKEGLELDFVNRYFAPFYSLLLEQKYHCDCADGELTMKVLERSEDCLASWSTLNKDLITFFVFKKQLKSKTVSPEDMIIFEKKCQNQDLKQYALDEYFKMLKWN